MESSFTLENQEKKHSHLFLFCNCCFGDNNFVFAMFSQRKLQKSKTVNTVYFIPAVLVNT